MFGACEPLGKRVGLLLHGVGQVLRVGTRVGEELFFVEVLRAVQHLLCAELETLVAFLLQFSQVKGLLRELLLLLGVDFCDGRRCGRLAAFYDRVRLRLFLENRDFEAFGLLVWFLRGFAAQDDTTLSSLVSRLSSDILCLKAFPRPDDAVVVQLLELLHQGVAFHDQVQGRRLHAPHRNHLPAARRKRVGACRIEAHHPVGTLAQPCGIAQVHALGGVFQVLPRLVQILRHIAVHPQALDGLLLEGGRKIEHQVENQVTFAAGIRAVHENVGLLHHLSHHVQLLLGALDFHEAELFGQKWQVRKPPASLVTGVGVERRERYQVAHAPGDAVVLADKAAVALRELLALDAFKHRAVVLVCDGRFFGDKQNHFIGKYSFWLYCRTGKGTSRERVIFVKQDFTYT